VKFAKDRIPLFQERILTALSPEAALLLPLEKGEHLFKALSSIGEDMFVQKGHHSHCNHKVLTLWNDIEYPRTIWWPGTASRTYTGRRNGTTNARHAINGVY
jgi:hypothetical protein